MCNDLQTYRMVQKMGLSDPTIPPNDNFNDGTWLETDIMEGELYLNYFTKTLFTQLNGEIVMITKGGESYYQVIDDEDNSGSAPYVTKIRSAENIRYSGVASLNGEPVATITVNGSPYTYNDPIDQGDVIEFTHTTNGVTRFKAEVIV